MKKRQLMAVLLSLTLMGSTVVSPLTALATTEESDTFQTQTAGDTDFGQQEGTEDSFETGEIAEEENSTFQNGDCNHPLCHQKVKFYILLFKFKIPIENFYNLWDNTDR
ncbi:MAG: hypothetical protein ACLU5G_03880 [Blautia sp.]